MKVIKRLGSVVIIMFMAGQLFGKPTTSIAIFNHSVGARQLGMADVAVGIADDVNTLFYNPGGIAQIRELELNAMYFDNIVDTTDESLSLIYPLRKGIFGKRAGLGIGIKAFQGGDLEFIQGEFISGGTFVETSRETLSAENDYMVGVGYGEELLNGNGSLSGGIVVKGIHSTLVEKYTATAFALDIGLLYQTPVEGLNMGLSFLNNGTDMKFIKKGDALPSRTVVGLSYGFKPGENFRVKIGGDYVKEVREDGAPNLGIELKLMDVISLRGGYYGNSDLKSATAGIGIKIGMIQIDYGYGMMDDMNNVQKMSLTMRWDTKKADENFVNKKKKPASKKKIVKNGKKRNEKKKVVKKKIRRKNESAKKRKYKLTDKE